MKGSEIKVGGVYAVKVGGRISPVRVDAIDCVDGFRVSGPSCSRRGRPNRLLYRCTNLATNRKVGPFRSAAKFQYPWTGPVDGTIFGLSVGPLGGLTTSVNDTVPDPTERADMSEGPDDDQDCTCKSRGSEWSGAVPDTTTAAEGGDCPDPTGSITTRAGSDTAAPTNLFARIAAATRGSATVPDEVTGYHPTDEQRAGLEMAVELFRQQGPRVLVLVAGAGAGKTSELKMVESLLPGRGQYTAFNKSLVVESSSKFKRASCKTTHSLAFGAVGRQFQHRLNGPRVRGSEVAAMLKIGDYTVAGAPYPKDSREWAEEAMNAGYSDQNPPPDDFAPRPFKTLRAGFLASQVVLAVRKFCGSADRELGEQHFHYVDGIDQPVDDGDGKKKRGWEQNNRLRKHLLPYARAAWADLNDPKGQLPYQHDYYVKSWQLSDDCVIPADYILLDEAQDTAPVFLDILQRQTHAMLILVGDGNQSIYEWRGAVDAMKAFPGAPRSMLSQSFRFGQVIADVANSVLATLEEPTDLVMRGLPSIPSRCTTLEEPRAVLCRTNAGAVGRVLEYHAAGRKPHLIGGGGETVRFVRAALDLQKSRGTDHPELCCFKDWAEVQTYVKEDPEGGDLKLMVDLIDKFGATDIIDALEHMPKEEDAGVVVSTAHKSKGREWTSVKLASDFRLPTKMDDAERRLLYVALTRAQEELDTSECPAFCGGYDKDSGEDGAGAARFVPGIDIEFTVEVPTQEALDAYRAGKGKAAEPAKTAPAAPGGPIPAPAPDRPAERDVAPANGNPAAAPEFTWANLGSGWLIRGPGGHEGKCITVTRRNGSTSKETLKKCVKQLGDLHFYSI